MFTESLSNTLWSSLIRSSKFATTGRSPPRYFWSLNVVFSVFCWGASSTKLCNSAISSLKSLSRNRRFNNANCCGGEEDTSYLLIIRCCFIAGHLVTGYFFFRNRQFDVAWFRRGSPADWPKSVHVGTFRWAVPSFRVNERGFKNIWPSVHLNSTFSHHHWGTLETRTCLHTNTIM